MPCAIAPTTLWSAKSGAGEAADLLQALNTGHGGSLTTIHANNAESALSRLATCAMQGETDLPWEVTCRGVVDGISMVIHMTRREGRRFVEEALFVRSYDAGKNSWQTDPVWPVKHDKDMEACQDMNDKSKPALSPVSPQARHRHTRFDQVNQLVGASEADPDLGFMGRVLALCSLPRTNPGTRDRYVRKNGPFTLIMIAGEEIPELPYGTLPRLLMAWVSTEAVRTQSRELVLGDSLSDFMRTLGIYNSGGHPQTRLKNQMRRLFSASIRLIHKHEHGERFIASQIADRGEFWWNPKRPEDRTLWQSKIELGEKFFQEIVRNPVPLDMNTLKALRRSPLGLDLYMWLTYRTFSLDGPLRLSWPMLYRQFGGGPEPGERQVRRPQFPHRLPPGVEEDQDGLAGPRISHRARPPARKVRRVGSASVRAADPAPEARPVAQDRLGACRELAPSKQESTTYEPSLICKLLILGCRLLIPDRLLGTPTGPPDTSYPSPHGRSQRINFSGPFPQITVISGGFPRSFTITDPAKSSVFHHH